MACGGMRNTQHHNNDGVASGGIWGGSLHDDHRGAGDDYRGDDSAHACMRGGEMGSEVERARGSVGAWPRVCVDVARRAKWQVGVGQPGLVEGAPLRWERGIGHLGAVRLCVGVCMAHSPLVGEVAPKKLSPTLNI